MLKSNFFHLTKVYASILGPGLIVGDITVLNGSSSVYKPVDTLTVASITAACLVCVCCVHKAEGKVVKVT